jgi:hypothetical protein
MRKVRGRQVMAKAHIAFGKVAVAAITLQENFHDFDTTLADLK